MTVDSSMLPLLLLALASGIGLGMLLQKLFANRRQNALQSEIASLKARARSVEEQAIEREQLFGQVEQRLALLTGKLASESLARNNEAFLQLATQHLGRQQEAARAELGQREQAVATLVKPIAEALTRTNQQLEEMEKSRREAFGGVRAQLEAMHSSQQALQAETRNLSTALRRPEVRGRWGEMTLRRIAELAGMVEHCDFNEQVSSQGIDGNQRPDMLVRLPGGGVLVVDVKTPLDAYLDATEASEPAQRKNALQRHARNLQQRVRELAAKSYWSAFENSPEMVILFVPGDQFLAAALDENPALLESAMGQKVVLATPSSFMALLTTVAHGWRQLALTSNAEEIRKLGEELYNRLATFSGHLGRLGRQLEGSVNAYNQAIGSLERMVLPGARKLTELGIRSSQHLPEPAAVDNQPRIPVSNETDEEQGNPS